LKPTVWSIEAATEFEAISEFWTLNNNSNAFSVKLWKVTNKAVEVIEINPLIGVKTNVQNVRMKLVTRDYYLVYKILSSHIEILKFWDVRQNPSSNPFQSITR
jgi:toxin YoeB